jgi:hypothetical protein
MIWLEVISWSRNNWGPLNYLWRFSWSCRFLDPPVALTRFWRKGIIEIGTWAWHLCSLLLLFHILAIRNLAQECGIHSSFVLLFLYRYTFLSVLVCIQTRSFDLAFSCHQEISLCMGFWKQTGCALGFNEINWRVVHFWSRSILIKSSKAIFGWFLVWYCAFLFL